MPSFRQDPAHMTQWPLPDDDLPPNVVDQHGRLFVPRGPPPQRPPRPDVPSPSVYSERSLPVATEDLFRQSAVSSSGSIPSIPDFPVPAQAAHAEDNVPQRVPRGRTSNLAPPTSRPSMKRRSSVSPIPEESPRGFQGSVASSRVIPSSWGSGPAESEILGTYLDVDSDDSDPKDLHEANTGLVRQASLGKRGKPSLRTIQRSTTESPAPSRDEASKAVTAEATPTAISKGVSGGDSSAKAPRDSFLTSSTDSSHFDPEKLPIVLDEPRQTASPDAHDVSALEKEAGVFPKAAPTMSDKRPGGRRPPRLDMSAVRDAEKRGSLTSLPDLIRRATKLATNLEHGRTASRNDLLNGGGGPRFPWGHEYRKSGSIRSILASFPPPAATPENGYRSSWPVFFRRSTLHHLDSHDEGADQEKDARPQRRCCGMPPWLFVLVLFIIIAIILVAVLVPVFLVAIPKSHASSANTCEKTTPCENGGVSVSSADVCSCVCTNGFTGSRCTVAGDASCITTELNGKNATVGSDLPRLFTQSSETFDIDLDPTTIMALFSQNNVSCTTENALVSFRGVSSSKTRRSVLDLGETEAGATKTLAARGATATANGIVFDNSGATKTKPSPTATTTDAASATSATGTASPTATALPSKAVDFSRVAVLYILEKTGTLGAAMLTEERLQKFLGDADASSIGSQNCTIDLADAGLLANFTLDYGRYQITKA
ncbi:hypothetical protein ALT_2106 [Aspergillus terreus]|uniref:EGF-like domain-containing protein n=1 Tax=Aspergillus terreus TaxID=33178 RepID=A0A8H3MWB0_ASPTE|nr:hypothetical protein ALT_2106 [Aspergillus terreus]